ncbi:hypothetical protein [Actinomadura gamaensis]|uniref:Uncharacterized protein n=1 Tax=Actinomadura gamaensis TaxID=1763541 RepID=A0ABV9U1V2_9ACTN
MSFDGDRKAGGAVDRPLPSSQRRTFLEVLHQVVGETQPGVRSGLVARQGCPVLFVFNSANVALFADVGCDFDAATGWSFTWAENGCSIGPVEDASRVAASIARALRVAAEPRP